MTAKRDSLFPSASIGKAQGSNIVRTPSRESLTVHPLLSPAPAVSPSGAALDSAKYVPYTPRQRLATTSAPTQALTTPSQGSVSGKQPLATLRAATQSIGLDANSVGWAILEKISYEGDTSDEWSEIWNALTKARATLCLPSEPCSPHDSITPEFVQDHLVLCDLACRDNTAAVTLSGLRGQLIHDTLTFRSTLHRSTKPFQTLLTSSVSRTASLDALPPLPAYPLESSYPSFAISAFSAALPLPSRATKPPLPPRPNARGASAPSSARLSVPFASLFGQRPSTPPPPHPPATPSTPTTTIPAPPPTEADFIDISAFVVDAVVSRTEIATAIIGTLKGEIAIALNDQPPWLVERVHAFSLAYFPFVKVPAGKKKLQDIGGNPNRVVYAANGSLDKPDELADKFQAFYSAVEAELRHRDHGQVEGGNEVDANGPPDPEAAAGGKEQVGEAQIRGVLETIESTLCMLLYDRLFLPSTSDDASHNEALSSRIAALNMLDLGLEHLDIDIGDANLAEVDAVVHRCGQTLARLDSTARSPREKAAVLVSAHELIVEGLSTIPPVRLKSRDDADKDSAHLSDSTSTEHAGTTSITPVSSTRIAPPLEHTEKESPSIPTVQLSITPVSSTRIAPPLEHTEKESPSIPTVQLSISPDRPLAIRPPSSSETVPPLISSPVSGDILLPLLIYSVVKANPHRLVSHLLFTQRFRNQSFGGEESYCLINLMAVAEFLENVDLGALGLGESEKKVISTADLTPIPIARAHVAADPSPITSAPTSLPLPGEEYHAGSLRGRVGQGVDTIAGSANKVLLGVVDSSFGVLRAFLPGQTVNANTSTSGGPSSGGMSSGGEGGTSGAQRSVVPVATGPSANTAAGMGELDAAIWGVRPSLGLLRRETGFSIAGLTAALPGGGSGGASARAKSRSQSHHEEEKGQRELVEVVSPRPPSLRSRWSGHEEEEEESATDNSSEEEGSVRSSEGEESATDTREDGEIAPEGEPGKSKGDGQSEGEEENHDARSIKSFESMLSSGRAKSKSTAARSPAATSRRKRLTDLTDRLTHGMAGMSKRMQSGDAAVNRATTSAGRLPPPNRRFVECTEQDIRVSEVGELLREYQRLVEAVRGAGGFQE